MVLEANSSNLVIVFFFYGLAFYSMGLAIILEGRRGSDVRLRLALRPLAAFGLIHGLHEWMDMFEYAGLHSLVGVAAGSWVALKLSLLAFSFLSLAGFGFSYLTASVRFKRISQLAPLVMALIWGFGTFSLRYQFASGNELWQAANAWTRYSLGIPSALIASIGLVAQQRAFRRSGMARFGRDSLIAAIAFVWYGLVGQVFVHSSNLVPSTIINEDLFFRWFSFPVQMLRAGLAIVVAISVIRFMRAFDAELRREIADLQQAQLKEARERESLRGQLLQRVVSAQEAERLRVARELHDETGQTLTAIGMGLRGLSDSLPKDPKRGRQILKKLEDLTAKSLNELQRMIGNLRPTHLDDLGLPAALRWYLGETQKHMQKPEISFSLAGDTYPLPPAVEIALYRIVQEAITNVLKHAQADHVSVDLRYLPDQVRIEVHDDGIGMDLDQVNSEGRRALGLLGMQERAALLGGEAVTQSRPGAGAYVLVSIPLEPNEHLIDQENAGRTDG